MRTPKVSVVARFFASPPAFRHSSALNSNKFKQVSQAQGLLYAILEMSMRPSVQRSQGFTLLELLVVVVIIGILLTAMSASFKKYKDSLELRGFSSAILAKCREAKIVGTAQNAKTKLYFDFASSSVVTLVADTNGIYRRFGATLSPQNPSVVTVRSVSGITSIGNSVDFLVTGLATDSSTASGAGSADIFVHVGAPTATYATGEENAKQFKTIVIFRRTGNAMLFNKGCFPSYIGSPYSGWGWPECPAL